MRILLHYDFMVRKVTKIYRNQQNLKEFSQKKSNFKSSFLRFLGNVKYTLR